MANSTVVKNMNDGTLTITDSAGAPLSTGVLAFDSGDLSISGLRAKLRSVVAYQRRGKLASVRHAERTFPQLTFTVQFTEWGDDNTTGTAVSALLKQGAWSAATSGLVSLGDVWGFGLAFAYEGTDLGDSGDHNLTFAKVVPTSVDFSEGSPSTLSVTADVYGAIGGDITLASP